jgi:hypothetical protein
MQTAELKTKLINKIMLIEDDHLLMEAIRLIGMEGSDDEEVFIFSEIQSERINNALQQIENGEYLSAKDANMEIEQWLK